MANKKSKMVKKIMISVPDTFLDDLMEDVGLELVGSGCGTFDYESPTMKPTRVNLNKIKKRITKKVLDHMFADMVEYEDNEEA
jgi:hypothetical protein